MSILDGSVGQGGNNHAGDVRLVQHLLNDDIGRTGGTLLAVDGSAGAKTNAAIAAYQKRYGLVADGKVDVNGATIKKLATDHVKALSASIVRTSHVTGVSLDQSVASKALGSYWKALKTA